MTAADCAFVISLIAYPEREQNVAGNTAPLRVPGIEVEHTIDEYGAPSKAPPCPEMPFTVA
jgi:hypothetical protein